MGSLGLEWLSESTEGIDCSASGQGSNAKTQFFIFISIVAII
jgi:hypothetical protein